MNVALASAAERISAHDQVLDQHSGSINENRATLESHSQLHLDHQVFVLETPAIYQQIGKHRYLI
jgi:hypothetical protein